MIRPATIGDIPALVELGRIFHASTRLVELVPYDEDSVVELLAGMIRDAAKSVVMVMEIDGVVAGGICGVVVPVYWNQSVLIGQQFAWFVHPNHRGMNSIRLLAALEGAFRGLGATVKSSGAKKNESFKGMDAVLTRRDYFELESMYMGRL